MQTKPEWILFDYGGCLDSDGIHSRTLYFNVFKKIGLIKNEQLLAFENAYTMADQEIVNNALVVNSGIEEMNQKMCELICEKLYINISNLINAAANEISKIQSFHLSKNKKMISEISKKYKLGIVSNFSGNLENILKEFGLEQYFSFVIDSYHAGISKPNPQIFNLALKSCGVPAINVCFVGDNLERDIRPAKALGMTTFLISSSLVKSEADFTLPSVEKLIPILS